MSDRLETQNDLVQRPFRHVMDALGVAVVGDVAFARPELYEHLEAEGYRYAIRLPGNDVLERAIEPLLTRPVGRPPNRPVGFYDSFPYQAASWRKPRRVVAKVALPGHPRTHSAAQAARDGTPMTPTKEETVGGSGGHGDGLRESTANGCLSAGSPRNIARSRPGIPCAEQIERLTTSRSVIPSSERPTVVVGMTLSGKCRLHARRRSVRATTGTSSVTLAERPAFAEATRRRRPAWPASSARE